MRTQTHFRLSLLSGGEKRQPEIRLRSQATRETYVAETNFAARKQENVFASDQKQFSFRNNVSSL